MTAGADLVLRDPAPWGVRLTLNRPDKLNALNVELRDALSEAVAEAEGHHPDLTLSWGKVGVEIYTHKIKGLSEADFVLAAKYSRLYAHRNVGSLERRTFIEAQRLLAAKIKARYNREHPEQPFLRLRIRVLTWPRILAGYEAGREPGMEQLVTWHSE